MISTLPPAVKSLFPKENIEFADSITKEESEKTELQTTVCKRPYLYRVLVQVFNKHACFDEIGEMIEAVKEKSPELAKRMRVVLDGNCARLATLSPEAIAYSKKVVHFVTHVMCSLTLGKQFTVEKAEELHKEFHALPAADQAALKKANPDIQF
ncbi:unnamed protein product [Nippostrongylus brasiliensis]|uniref:DUF659 domain-containing protein n=1 Tax=Nippostrongylus brasiliensis TaxID=27835 RepID=A0A0N4YFR1_NIPBR|nr:unnamed protein product [Nippostrongylus brasiliensis]